MKRDCGAILPMTLILVAALLLLTNTMYLLNRQYQSEIEAIDVTAVERQTLLSIGKDMLQNLTNIDGKDLVGWEACDPFIVPLLLLDSERNIYYQQARLDDKCGFGYQGYRVWLTTKDSGGALLVLDALLLDVEEWQEEITSEGASVSVEFKDTQWVVQIEHHHQVREISIFDEADQAERHLKYRQMRKYKDNTEIVLVFGNIDQNHLELHRLVVGLNEWGLAVFDELQVDAWKEDDDQVNIRPLWRAQVSKDWRLILPNRELDEIFIYDQVIFLAFKQQDDVGVVAITLAGWPFLGEEKLGVQKPAKEGALEDYVVIECHKSASLLIGARWQMGCFNRQVIRYYYLESLGH